MSDNSSKIKELEQQITNLKAEDEYLQSLTPVEKVAIALHSAFCIGNHTDGCSWFYEMKNGIDDWNGNTHDRYLTKATLVLAFCNTHKIMTQDAIDLMKIAHGY